MKKYIRSAIPGREIVASTRAIKASYTPRYSRESEIEDYEIDELLEMFGGRPVKKWFIANPEYYGERPGAYGSDYAISFYKLDNGKYVSMSEYSGSEEYKDEAEMEEAMKATEDSFDEDAAEYEAEYEDEDDDWDW